ncbi:FdrA family protein [Nonomuraea roseoviolacea]|uniref:FdrA protein n=1 Tax=Nonomuraea roseoviolacea subsp. carminata TaxID=160689 RepID=A0ABT1K7M9_9ACTN|nr:FdrA family protein [Nonomuraea roseoviolacea]MCP2350012.1 FdrA protein [Nonomuraea roseoviolacea subsp. carminata]
MSSAVVVRAGVYHDSVTLMRVSRALSDLPGMDVALVAMATELNLAMARDLGFDPPPAGPADLLVALRGQDVAAAERELDRLLSALSSARGSSGSSSYGLAGAEGPPPRTTRSAAARAGEDAGVALISVPGEHVLPEAVDAVEAGLDVMIFSDGVPVWQEVLLKRLAAEHGVLVMGPDCGTAVIAGVGLGFANVLRPGPVGVVAASGTGAQQVTSLLDLAGVGVRHVLGVGGRDLSREVGGLSAVRALRLLDEDPATELIVLVSKPPDPEVARAVQEVVESLRTPVVPALTGRDDLTDAAERVLRALGTPVPAWPSWPAPARRPPKPGAVRGLYAGGTLCAEAAAIAASGPGAASASGAAPGSWSGSESGSEAGAGTGSGEASGRGSGEFVDFGDDAYTRGRAHPLIDPALRLDALARVGPGEVALLDVVLGHGADPDPAASLAPAVARCPAAAVVVALVGTEGDPQGLHRQAAAFREAGASVFVSNAQAARYARDLR